MARGTSPADVTTTLLYERDDLGAVRAIEVLRASRWRPDLLAPPAATVADVRVVLLESGSRS